MNTEKIGWTNLEKLHPFFKQWSTVWKTKYTGNRKINYRFTNEYVQLAIRVTEENFPSLSFTSRPRNPFLVQLSLVRVERDRTRGEQIGDGTRWKRERGVISAKRSNEWLL